MVTKTLTVTEAAYNLLKSRKMPNESFSEFILRKMSADRMEHFGAWKNMPKEELEEIKRDVRKARESLLRKLHSETK